MTNDFVNKRRFHLAVLFPAFIAAVFLACALFSVSHAETPQQPQATPPVSTPAHVPPQQQTRSGKITVNFVDVDITTLVRFISDSTGKNFIYDEKLRGKVTIIAPTPLEKDEAFNLFTSILALKGFAMVQVGQFYKIVPSNLARESATAVVNGEAAPGVPQAQVNEGHVLRLVPLKYTAAHEFLPVLKPLMSADGYISAFGQGNALLLLDSALNVEKVMKIISLVDVENALAMPEIVHLKHADAEGVMAVIGDAEGPRGRPSPMQAQGAATLRLIPDKRLNAIIIFGKAEEIEKYKKLIALVDVPGLGTASRINVYYLENAEAGEIAEVLKTIIGDSTPVKTQATGAEPDISGPPPMPPHLQQEARKIIGPAELAGKIAITPHAATNSLVIMASPESFATLKRVIELLDRRPKQVFVEAMIMEVSINDAMALGAKWRASATENGKPIVIGGLGTLDAKAVASILTGITGFTLGGVGNTISVPVIGANGVSTVLSASGYAALFSLSEFGDAVNVLSTPHILTSDNKEAEIVVGENVPFLSQIERSTSTTNQPLLQSIERKDVGITLRIKPQISKGSEGDYVKLQIYQEISAIAPTALAGGVEAADIITTKRSASTSVVVKDKQTVVIGGLVQDRSVDIEEKVPVLGDIPFLGWLFKSSSVENKKTNLLVYLTPTIATDFDGLDRIRDEKSKRFEGAGESGGAKGGS
jgi:general secretion pathway protein D